MSLLGYTLKHVFPAEGFKISVTDDRAAAGQQQILDHIQELKATMSQFSDDVTQLTTEVSGITTALNSLADVLAKNTVTIADMQTQIDSLKASTNVDLSGLEGAVSTLHADNVKAKSLLPAPAETATA